MTTESAAPEATRTLIRGSVAGVARRRLRRAGVAVAGAGLAVGLAACSPTPANEGHGPLGQSQAVRETKVPVIYITSKLSYSPDVVHAKVGDNILVVNNSTDNHTLTADNGSFGTPVLAAGGDDGSFVVKKAGTFHFYDVLHPTMRGTIIVSR